MFYCQIQNFEGFWMKYPGRFPISPLTPGPGLVYWVKKRTDASEFFGDSEMGELVDFMEHPAWQEILKGCTLFEYEAIDRLVKHWDLIGDDEPGNF